MIRSQFLYIFLFLSMFSQLSICQTADTLNLELSMFSGRPDPVLTLKDSVSVALIKNRMGYYLLRSDNGDLNAPQPLSYLGYRGVKVKNYPESAGLDCFLSNGAAVFNFQGADHRFFDYRSEFQKMVLRFLRRQLVSSSQPGLEFFQLIPDSLFSEYESTGLFTIEDNILFSGNGYSVDISQLGNGYHYLTKNQDTSSVVDFSLNTSPSGGIIIKSRYGVAKGVTTLPGLPLIESTSADTGLIATYSTVLYLSKLKPAILTFQQEISCDLINKTGNLFLVRTSEGGYATIVTAGRYIGGINRIHLYYCFSTDDVFGPVETPVQVNKQSLDTRNILKTVRDNNQVNLQGQQIKNNETIRNRFIPKQQMLLK